MTAEVPFEILSPIGIIGGAGKMGQWLVRLFEAAGIDTLISDRTVGLPIDELVSKSSVVIVSVPMGVTLDVIEQVVPLMRPGQMLCDTTSVKVLPVNAMLAANCEVLGLHPMFGPLVPHIRGQTVVCCEVRVGEIGRAFLKFLGDGGALLTSTTPEEHDRVMGIVQGITHFSSIAAAHCLRALGITVEETMRFTSPVYKLRMNLVGRILSQDPDLYADIALLNPYVKEAIVSLEKSSSELLQTIVDGNREQFIAMFEEASGYIGSLKQKVNKDPGV